MTGKLNVGLPQKTIISNCYLRWMEKYGRLKIIGYSGNKSEDGHKLINAICDCGNIWEGRKTSLVLGYTRSCGCLEKEEKSKRSHVLADANRKHGASMKTHPHYRLYIIWKAFNGRCLNEKDRSYSDYGGRGIKIYSKWRMTHKAGFENFLVWALPIYEPGLQLDRKKNNSGYFPNNCRFVTQEINQRNTRRNVKITYNGITKLQIEWAEYLKVSYQSIHYWRKAGVINKYFAKHEPNGKIFTRTTKAASCKAGPCKTGRTV